MKKQILLITALFFTAWATAQAQTQQGYVKTKGRMVNGQLVPGQGLKGATVSIKGRTAVLVNADDGSFSFPVPGEQFRVDSVRKKGYQLVDMDALSKTYKHSANPIYFVMETPEQQLQDQLDAERKIRRTLTNQLHQHEDEIEMLKNQQKISEEEYRLALQKLYEETDQNDQLVKDMVERYSKIDYDQLSEFDKQISEYILNGELTKADSLLRTKGDLNQRAKEYQKHKAINAKEKEKLSQRQEQLEQSELLAQKELEDLANDCYRKFEIFKMQHWNDSAAYYLELRAELDTTNIEWLNQAGLFFVEYKADYANSMGYYQKALTQALKLFGEKSDWIAKLYNNIGSVYFEQGDDINALECHNKALAIRKSVFNECHPDVATSYNNIGDVYVNQGNYERALEYFNKALAIRKSVFDESHPDIALSYNDIGYLYFKKGEYEKSLKYYEMSIAIKKALGENNPSIAISYNNIGLVYFNQIDYGIAQEYFEKALTIQTAVFGESHPDIAKTYNSIGMVCANLGDYAKAIDYYGKALTVWEFFFGKDHRQAGYIYSNIAFVYLNQDDYVKALEYLEKTKSVLETVLEENHPDVAICYNNIGQVYYKQCNYEKSLEYYFKSLAILESVFRND